eukprot:632441-Amphidinium_carterae.1
MAQPWLTEHVQSQYWEHPCTAKASNFASRREGDAVYDASALRMDRQYLSPEALRVHLVTDRTHTSLTTTIELESIVMVFDAPSPY